MSIETAKAPLPPPSPPPPAAGPPRPGIGATLAIDYGPLLLFFLTNFFAPVPSQVRIFYATGIFMVAMMFAMLVSQIRYRSISPMLWFSGIMVSYRRPDLLPRPTFIISADHLYAPCGLRLFGSGRPNLLKIGSAGLSGLRRRWLLLTALVGCSSAGHLTRSSGHGHPDTWVASNVGVPAPPSCSPPPIADSAESRPGPRHAPADRRPRPAPAAAGGI